MAIWRTLDTMVWTDVAFNALKTFAKDNDENALNNPLIVEALVRGHMATAIRRLMEKTHDKERLSVPRLVNDLKRHRKLFTRENYVCYDGLP
jgi:hypothetical protein